MGCRHKGLDEADTLDVGQDAFVSVFAKLHQFRKERPGDSFRRWLKTVVLNKVIDLRRTRQVRPKALGGSDAAEELANHPDVVGDEENPSDDGEERQLLRRALEMIRGDFEPRTWNAFWRVVVEDAIAADVAAELGITTNAVHLAKSRVLRRLQDEFAQLLEVDNPA